MATSIVSRLAPVTARDGVNTRKQANWARVAAQPRKTICRSDMIIGLEQLVAKQSLEGLQWGDIMTNNLRDYSSDAVIVYRETTNYDVWEDLADEPWKYGNDVFEWIDLDKKLANSPRVAAYWVFRAKLQEDKRVEVQRAWHEKMKPIAQLAATKGMQRWIQRDIKAFVAKIKNAATKIQAATRGYQTRCHDAHQDCCMCLSHRISPFKTEVGFMCRDCANGGPHEQVVENDPWNWYRA